MLNLPTVRIFDQEEQFAFANANAIVLPGGTVRPRRGGTVDVVLRPVAVVGADEGVAGFTLVAEVARARRLLRRTATSR